MPAPYLGEVLARGVNGRDVSRVRERASFAGLTLAGSKEFAGNVRSI